MLVLDTVARPVKAVAFSPAGELAVSDRYTVGVWPPAADAARFTDSHTGGGSQLAFTPDGRWLLTEGDLVHGVHAWRTDTGEGAGAAAGNAALLVKPAGSTLLLAVAPDGRFVAVSLDYYAGRRRHIQWYDFAAGGWTDERSTPDEPQPLAVALRPDGRHLALSSEWAIEVWDVARRRARAGLVEKPVGGAPRLAYSPAGDRLVCGDGRQVVVYTTTRYKAVAGFTPGRSHVTGLAFHPSGRWLAVTSNDAAVRLFDTATWQPACTFTWEVGKLWDVAFSPDGLLAAAGGQTGRVVVWDVDL